MDLPTLILGAAGVWRVTHLLNAESGPWDLFVKLRALAGAGFFGELLDCFYCLSLSVAVPFTCLLAHDWRQALLLWPGLSGAAILLERVSGEKRQSPMPIYYEEEKEEHHGMLRG